VVESSLTDKSIDGLSVQRFFWLPLGISGVLVLLVLVGLVVMSWRSLDRLLPVQQHLADITRIQDVGLSMEAVLLKGLQGVPINREALDSLGQRVGALTALEGMTGPDTAQRLDQIATTIQATSSMTGNITTLFDSLAQIRSILSDERAQHDALLMEMADNARMELRLAVGLLLVLPVVGGLGLWLLQRRTEQPLKDLQGLLSNLSGRDFHTVPDAVLQQTTRLARPAFDSYNTLVNRLQELEAEHQDRERLLEQRVREATEALLEQSRELSRAERLAAVGAVSAGLTHELRNPLAGVLLACNKLQEKLANGDQSRRIDAVITELKRIDHLLTAQLDATHHAPEAAVPTRLARVVDDLLGLLRYQVSADFVLQSDVDPSLYCLLPVAGLRQALLNLVLNAVQIQGQRGRVGISGRLENGQVVLRVSDDGPGFPDTILRAGIRPFATGRTGGTGLGLAMVRRFVRDLDGDLKLENRSPGGARVILYLPYRPAPDAGVENSA